MLVVEKNKDLSNIEHTKLISQAWYEKEQYGKVSVKCPKCNDIVEVELLGNSARTKCSCGYMTDSLRGI